MSLRFPTLLALLSLSTQGFAQDTGPSLFSETPERLQALAREAKAKDPSSSHILQQDLQIKIDESGRLHRSTHWVAEIRSELDVKRWSGFSVPWRKSYEQRPRIQARVIRPDGEVRLLDPATVVEGPAGEVQDSIYSDAIVLKILPPGLVPGSLLELSIEEHESKALFQSGRYVQVPLLAGVPMDRLHITLSWHPSQPLRYRWSEAIKLKKTEGQTTEGWPLVHLEANHLEAEDAKAIEDGAPASVLELSSASSWATAAADYQKIVDAASVKKTKIPALAKKLLQGRTRRDDIIAAVTSYVQKEIRYISLAFGEASVIPRSPDETLERGYGDCKDKAVLAQALLKEAGINSQLALLHSAPEPSQSDDMPGLDRFNHVVLAVEQGTGRTWIDLTAEYYKPGFLPPAVAGQKALLISAASKGLTAIPTSSMEDNRVTITKVFQVERLGPARLLRTETASGIFEPSYRRTLASSDVKDMLLMAESALDPAIKLESARATDYKDLNKPMTLEGQFKNVTTVDVWPNGTQTFTFPNQMFNGLPAILDPLQDRDVRSRMATIKSEIRERQEPLAIPFAFQRDFIFRFQLPPSLDLSDKPQPTRLSMGPASFTLKTRDCGKSCFELHYSFSTGSEKLWTPRDLQDYANSLQRVMDEELYTLTIKPKALILSEQGKLREAIQLAQKLVQEKDAAPADQLTLAHFLARVGLKDEAQQAARAAIKAQPNEKRILLHAADLFIYGDNRKDCSRGSDCPQAIQLFEQALKLDPKDHFALRSLALLSVFNSKGLRYGRGADMQKADAAFAQAMKGSLADDQEFFSVYLQHLAYTGQWIALDQALRHAPEAMPTATIAAWRVITLLGNQHPDEAKEELDQVLAKSDGQASIQAMIKELMQDRRYKEASELFRLIKEQLPQMKGASEALANMGPCPDKPLPDADLQLSLRHYICTMLSPDSSVEEGLEFVPSFARQQPQYQTYFTEVEWNRRLESAKADGSLPPYFLVDSASTAYDIEKSQTLQQGDLLRLHNSKVFAASPFAGELEEGFEPKVMAVRDKGAWRFIALDSPSVLSLLWFQAREQGLDKAAQDYAGLLGELLDRSKLADSEQPKLGPEASHYQNVLSNFRPLLKGSAAEQEITAAVYAPALLNDKALQVFDRALAERKLSPEQSRIIEALAAGRLVSLKKYDAARRRLLAQAEQGPFTFSMVQTLLELARSGQVKAEDLQPLLGKLEQSQLEERFSVLAEIKHLVGDQKGAERVYQQWLQNPAPNGLTENNVAWFYFTTGRSDQNALKLAQSASDLGQNSVANLNTLASIQAELGLTNESIATQMQYRSLLGDRDLGAADDLVTAINAEKIGLSEAALKRLKKIQVEPENYDLKGLLHAKIQRLEKGPKAR